MRHLRKKLAVVALTATASLQKLDPVSQFSHHFAQLLRGQKRPTLSELPHNLANGQLHQVIPLRFRVSSVVRHPTAEYPPPPGIARR